MIQLSTTSLTEVNLALLGALSFLIAAYAGIKQKTRSGTAPKHLHRIPILPLTLRPKQ